MYGGRGRLHPLASLQFEMNIYYVASEVGGNEKDY